MKKGFVKKWDKDEKNLWNSPLLAVPKKSGGRVDPDDIRVCLDLRAVNALTKDPSNILPSSTELFFFFFFEADFIQLVVLNLSHLNYIKLCLFLTSNER